MFKLFRKNDEKKQIEQLAQQIEALQQVIKELKSTPHYHVNIEKIDIGEAKLENLTFRLDRLDIEELSGALNLGNNFGVAVGEKNGSKKPSGIKMNQQVQPTKKGYSFSFQQQKEEEK